jgi:hypothetical protein
MRGQKFEDWANEYTQRERERLQNQSALNRLGQGNSGGVQRTPPARETPKTGKK